MALELGQAIARLCQLLPGLYPYKMMLCGIEVCVHKRLEFRIPLGGTNPQSFDYRSSALNQ